MSGSELLDVLHGGPGPWDQLQPRLDQPPNQEPSDQPFGTGNGYALPVNQRAPRHWSGHLMIVDGKDPTRLLDAQLGRVSFTIIVPAGQPGVVIDEQAGTLGQTIPQGFPLVTDSGVTVATEGAVYAISATPGTDTQVGVITTWG